MSVLNVSIIVDRSSAEVFSALTDFCKWPEWQGGLARVELISPGPLQAGSHLRQIRKGRNAMESILEVTRLVPNQILGLNSPSHPLPWQGTFTLVPVTGGTRLTLQYEIQASGPVGLLSDLHIRLILQHELATFKALVEAG